LEVVLEAGRPVVVRSAAPGVAWVSSHCMVLISCTGTSTTLFAAALETASVLCQLLAMRMGRVAADSSACYVLRLQRCCLQHVCRCSLPPPPSRVLAIRMSSLVEHQCMLHVV
jgi:hypothetical protein